MIKTHNRRLRYVEERVGDRGDLDPAAWPHILWMHDNEKKLLQMIPKEMEDLEKEFD